MSFKKKNCVLSYNYNRNSSKAEKCMKNLTEICQNQFK